MSDNKISKAVNAAMNAQLGAYKVKDYLSEHDLEPVIHAAVEAAFAATGKQQDTSSWSLHDRVEFALRDAGFDLDEASRIALLVDGKQQAGEVVVTRDEDGEIVLVSRQDAEGRILSVIDSQSKKS